MMDNLSKDIEKLVGLSFRYSIPSRSTEPDLMGCP